MNPNSNKDKIQTLRTVHQNQTQLNLMADQKANILIGTLALVFTIVFTKFVVATEQESAQLIPILILLFCEFIALILTTFVLIPKNINNPKSKDINNLSNPFFFGSYTQFSENEYQQYLAEKLIDDASAHRLLIKDIYQIGMILKSKYTLLRWAYFFALTGVALAMLSKLIITFI